MSSSKASRVAVIAAFHQIRALLHHSRRGTNLGRAASEQQASRCTPALREACFLAGPVLGKGTGWVLQDIRAQGGSAAGEKDRQCGAFSAARSQVVWGLHPQHLF